jgi:TonB family protein
MSNHFPMTRRSGLLLWSVVIIVFAISDSKAQTAHQTNETCHGPIYEPGAVTRRVRIIRYPDIQLTPEARAHAVHGRIIANAVMCRTGRVTDIKIVEGLPYGMNERAVQAIAAMKFTPAEKDWHTISQRMRFELSINEDFESQNILPSEAAGHIVETVQIIGNRRFSAKQILAQVHTRPGEPFNFDQANRDLEAILATGFFDKTGTKVFLDKGVRDGVVITFFIEELPLINAIRFENINEADQTAVTAGFQKAHLDLRIGAPYDAELGRAAVAAIKQVLASSGRMNADVEVRTDSLSASSISLTFSIRNH